jgi:hypothetical protein
MQEKQREKAPGRNLATTIAGIIILSLLSLLVSGLVNAYWQDSAVRTKIRYQQEPARERIQWFASGRVADSAAFCFSIYIFSLL